MLLINEVGNIYDRLKVLSRADNYRNYARWLCECECGNKIIVLGTSLRNKNTRSCGCLLKESASRNGKLRLEDLTDKYFGRLKCIKRVDSNSKDPLWLCECSCGSLTNVFANNLKKGSTQSCGCLKSVGEERISNILKQNSIPFLKEYCFKDCKYPDTLAPVRFDFWVNNSYLIEYDGNQHQDIDNPWHTQKLVEHDYFKTQWCKENNISLYRFNENSDLEKEILNLDILNKI